jgi:hypothetical protein
MKRGDRVRTLGGGEGMFVGERGGVHWVAYDAELFRGMCVAFDVRAQSDLLARQLMILAGKQ